MVCLFTLVVLLVNKIIFLFRRDRNKGVYFIPNFNKQRQKLSLYDSVVSAII